MIQRVPGRNLRRSGEAIHTSLRPGGISFRTEAIRRDRRRGGGRVPHDRAVRSQPARGRDGRAWLDDGAFSSPARRASVLRGVSEHDAAWILMDKVPLWNDARGAPYSFMDLPDAWKLPHYRHGVNLAEARDPYAGLLASCHYSAFFEGSANPDALAFLSRERSRQARA